MKDAKGHGSNSRGNMSVPDKHQHNIAVDTVKNPAKGFLGGPNAAEAEATLRSKFGYTDSQIKALKGMNEPRVGGPGQKGAAMGSKSSDYWRAKSLATAPGTEHQVAIAAQHGVPTGHIGGRVDRMSPADQAKVRAADHAREVDEGNRDFALRARNGQIGSGMKFRG